MTTAASATATISVGPRPPRSSLPRRVLRALIDAHDLTIVEARS